MEKCESWQVLVEHCLFDAPWWLEWWANYWFLRWGPLIVAGLVLMAVLFRFLHLLTLNERIYLQVGNLRSVSQVNSSKFLAHLLDYRWWVLVLSGIGFIVLFNFNYWAESPATIITIMGANSLWHLSPTGVMTLKNIVLAIGISNWIMICISAFSFWVLFIDPKLVRYSLRLEHKDSRPSLPIKFDNTDWVRNDLLRFSQRNIYVKSDGLEFSLSQKNSPDWMALYFDDHNTTLSGPGECYKDPNLGEIIWFKVGTQTMRTIENQNSFCVGSDKNSRSIFYFESNHI